jgi:CRISPR-associated protein Csm5
MESVFKLRVHVITPVHVGCDEVYEPTGFVIDQDKQTMVSFDPLAFIKSLSAQDRDKFSSICMRGDVSSILDIYKFIADANRANKIKGKDIEITKGLSEHYQKVNGLFSRDKNASREINQFIINRTSFNPQKGDPYIPGSSIKGSLRTAYLSRLAAENNIVNFWDKAGDSRKFPNEKYKMIDSRMAREFEKKLLQGDFSSDPFRLVRISDFIPVGKVKTKIVYAVNRKKKKSERPAGGPFQILEVIKEHSIFEGSINLQSPEAGSPVKTPVKMEKILSSTNEFYQKIFSIDEEALKEIGANHKGCRENKEIFSGILGKKAFLLRIGRHSGAESVTIEKNRMIKIMQGKNPRENPPKFLDHATTLWLASDSSKPRSDDGLTPFGWTILEII